MSTPALSASKPADPTVYLIRHPWQIRLVYVLGILTWFSVVWGYVLFFQLNPWYWLIFGPIVGVFTIYHVLAYGINACYPGFDLAAHERRVKSHWQHATAPAVDIFVPVAGESVDLLRRTFAAVRVIDYGPKTVYVLDDKPSAAVRQLAGEMGFRYLTRPDPGHMKKSGNLKHGHENSTSPFIAYFDADFAPHPQFLRELLPYMDDPRVAIVQSPQYFDVDAALHERAPVAFGAGHLQQDFYRIIQPARDRFGAAICVGTNALYRRSALDAVGGVEQIEHSEDILTGFKLTAQGWKIRYVPLVLATGFCPEDIHTYFHQQHRWCSGTLTLCLSKRFWTAHLPLAIKLCYLAGFFYYLFQPLALLMVFQMFVVLFLHFDAITLRHALPFVPHILFITLVIPLTRGTASRFGTFLARTTHVFSASHAILSHAAGRRLEWQPTNVRVTRVSPAFLLLLGMSALHFGLQAVLVVLAVMTYHAALIRLHYFPVTLWIAYHLVTGGMFLAHATAAMRRPA
ncbi:glycosyltransferase [Patescibacteria group bacterium]|nr:MAG: glycosyltransferase [Patescibacteria group bacterium]